MVRRLLLSLPLTCLVALSLLLGALPACARPSPARLPDPPAVPAIAVPRAANASSADSRVDMNGAVYPSCFPALSFSMPLAPPETLDGWWCDDRDEYAFLGFSYEVSACQSPEKLNADFADIRYHFDSRYVRLYGACDDEGFMDNLIQAAWNNGLGVHALVWFGFDGSDIWITRRDSLFHTLHTNPMAQFVVRVVQFGSEPLFDNVLPHQQLAQQVYAAKANLSDLGIRVTVSELAYGYEERGGAQDVLDAIDWINIHMLPFFDQDASTADKAWPIVVDKNLAFFIDHGNGKKMYLDENGWPSVTSPSVQNNSIYAVADVKNEAAYYRLLDKHCPYFKSVLPGTGGVGWFAHIYSDSMEPGYGIYDVNGTMKFLFKARTHC